MIKKSIYIVVAFLYCSIGIHQSHASFVFRNFNVSDGLSDNIVRAIAQDEQKFIWLGTFNGLCRFDGSAFTIFRHSPNDSLSLANNTISTLLNHDGGLLIGSDGGLDFYSIANNTFRACIEKDARGILKKLRNPVKELIRINDRIYILEKSGRLLVNKKNLIFESCFVDNHEWYSITSYNNRFLIAQNKNGIHLIDIESNKIVSVYRQTNNHISESIYFSKNQNLLFIANGIGRASESYHITYNNKIEKINIQLPSDAYRIIDYNDFTLFGANGKGLFVYKDNKFITLNTQNSTISSDAIYSMYVDSNKNLFIGTYRYGIDLFSENYAWFKSITSQNKILTDKIVAAISIHNDQIYIGLDGGGLNIFDQKLGTTTSYTTQNSTLPGNNIISIVHDTNYIWLGDYMKGICRFSPRDKKLKHYPLPSNTMLWTISSSGNDDIWVIGKSVYVFNKKSEQYSLVEGLNDIWASDITFFNDTAWISTGFNGIYKLSIKDKKIIENFTTDSESIPLPDNNISFIHADSNHNIWFSPSNLGLCRYNKNTRKFSLYGIKDGLSDPNVMSVLEDNEGFLWFGTNNGLFRYNRVNETFIRFGDEDNLPSTQFNHKASLKKGDNLYFGSTNGLIFFNSKNIKYNQTINPVFFQNIYILKTNQTITINDTTTKVSIELPYDQNFFTIHYSTPEFSFPEKVYFSYRMQNFEEEWRNTWDERKITYTNIPPGKYIFQIRQLDRNGQLSNNFSSMHITILPPWWLTNWAISIWILIAISLLILAYLLYLHEEKIKRLAKFREIEKTIEKRNSEIKLRFFTNISHEFRTPLSLILTPLEILVKNVQDSTLQNKLKSIHKNAESLLELVNQLLDFRKLEISGEKLHLTYGDIIEFSESIINSYADKVQNEQKELVLRAKTEHLFMYFDKDKLRKILNNLISNSLKFTLPGSQIIIVINKTMIDNINHAELVVSDNGFGIPNDKLPYIFDRFYKLDHGLETQTGSGIGLHLVKEYVNLHAGIITVESTVKKGSSFKIHIPLNLKPTEDIIEPEEGEDEEIILENITIKKDGRKTILIVEDNEDFRQFLVEQLETEFDILQAGDGEEGETISNKKFPNLIITDITMPKMDGVEFCKRIKNNIQTSHIPVILLTARASNEFILSGYEAGADEYISKPFNYDLLLLQIRKLIKQQEQREKQFRKSIDIKPNDITITSLDEKLIKDALISIEKNMNNSDYSVDDLSNDVGLSRTGLYQKIQSITSVTPLNFIRSVRLKRAAQLLRDSDLNISEVADYVGFGSIKYFNIHFKEEFKVTPTHYRRMIKENMPDQDD